MGTQYFKIEKNNCQTKKKSTYIFPSGVFASSPRAANSSGILCSGVNLSGKCAMSRPATDMSLFSTYRKDYIKNL